jgi:hypothetical protein
MGVVWNASDCQHDLTVMEQSFSTSPRNKQKFNVFTGLFICINPKWVVFPELKRPNLKPLMR